MEAERIAPFTSSPLDSARGRGKHSGMRIAHTQSRRKEKKTYETTINIVVVPTTSNTLSPNTVGVNVE
jgi:hypothetical protein